jgi:hypothetical protein
VYAQQHCQKLMIIGVAFHHMLMIHHLIDYGQSLYYVVVDLLVLSLKVGNTISHNYY